MTTILLADDHPVVLSGIRTTLERDPDFKIIGETTDGLEAVRLTQQLQPDVLVTDMMMPGLTGLEVARQVREQVPQTRILLLSMHANESYVLEALKHGATGYILKDSPAEELIKAVRQVATGKRYLSETLSERAIDLYIQQAATGLTDPYELLTNREREVLKLAAEGCNNPDIAERLFISPRTVETHRNNLMRKLGLQNQTDLITRRTFPSKFIERKSITKRIELLINIEVIHFDVLKRKSSFQRPKPKSRSHHMRGLNHSVITGSTHG